MMTNDDKLNGETELARFYRKTQRVKSPEQLDGSILAEAEKALARSRMLPIFSRYYALPAALAALLILGAVLLVVRTDNTGSGKLPDDIVNTEIAKNATTGSNLPERDQPMGGYLPLAPFFLSDNEFEGKIVPACDGTINIIDPKTLLNLRKKSRSKRETAPQESDRKSQTEPVSQKREALIPIKPPHPNASGTSADYQPTCASVLREYGRKNPHSR